MAGSVVGKIVLGVSLCLLATALCAQDANECDQPGEAPDVVVGDIYQLWRHGDADGITAFSVGTVGCNLGTCQAEWVSNSSQHPVIGQNLFRLKDGRFEQIGQSWVKHGFFARSETYCSDDCVATNGEQLGVNCSDPYSAFLNGVQGRLGPKSDVNAATGQFPYPFSNIDETGDYKYKRLQVRDDDLEPAQNPGALYFVEAQYVTADDSAAGNGMNNTAYRRVVVDVGGGDYELQFSGDTVSGVPAVQAWDDFQLGVVEQAVDVVADGRLVCAATVRALANGRVAYEYAVQNVTSHRSVRTFEVPLPRGAVLTGVGFQDADYHSAERWEGTDWVPEVQDAAVVWSTDTWEQNVNANAVRWGTLYNFRFEAEARPRTGAVRLGLFRPGAPSSVTCQLPVPDSCNGDGICQAGESRCSCPGDCGGTSSTEQSCADGVDNDCDGRTDCADSDCCATSGCTDGVDNDGDGYGVCDCDDTDPAIWSPPGDVPALVLDNDPQQGASLAWSPPPVAGGDAMLYDLVRAVGPAGAFAAADCLLGNDPSSNAQDAALPSRGQLFSYLVRASAGCPGDVGGWGARSDGTARVVRDCP